SAAQTSTASFTLTLVTGLSVTTTTLPGGTAGQSYNQSLAATGGTTPYTWAVTARALPPGLARSTAAVISGAPLPAGTHNSTVTVTAHLGAQANTALSITVAAGPLVILTTALPPGRLGQSYAAQFTASGGVQPYHWTLVSGTLPPGLTLNDDGSVTG